MLKEVLVRTVLGTAMTLGTVAAIGVVAELKDKIVGVDAKTAVIDVKAKVIE